MKKIGLIGVLAASSFVLQSSSLAQKQDGLDWIGKISRTYSSLSSYYIEAISINDQQQDESRDLTENPMVLAQARPGKFRLELKSPFMGASVISDGKTTWHYMAQGHQYSKGPADADKKEQNPFLPENYVEQYAKLADEVDIARLAGDETISFEGKAVECAVVEYTVKVSGPKAVTAAKAAPQWHKLWIEKSRFLVLQESWSEPPMDFMGIEMKTSRKIVFKTIRINEPVPNSVFSFVPPKNALEVEEVVPPGGRQSKILGKDAPALALASVDGPKTDIKDLHGKTLLLYVWATWCVPCRDTSAIVKKVGSQFKERGLVVLAINYGEEKKVVTGYLAKNPAAGTVLLDDSKMLAESWGVQTLPTLILISKDGKIVYQDTGFSDKTEASLAAALKEQGFD